MIEATIVLTAVALGALLWSLLEQRTDREQRRALAAGLVQEREAWTQLLAKASTANETLAGELARQRDQLASLEMRLGATSTRSFTPGR